MWNCRLSGGDDGRPVYMYVSIWPTTGPATSNADAIILLIRYDEHPGIWPGFRGRWRHRWCRTGGDDGMMALR